MDDRQTPDVEAIELESLILAVRNFCGYDFTGYSRASIRRRVARCLTRTELESFSQLQHAVLREPELLTHLLHDLSINTTEMFRDPAFYRALREEVMPRLTSWPFIKVWAAGCSSGEEVYSLSILLRESGLSQRSRIYATDFNPTILDQAREGVFSASLVKDYTRNYQLAGGLEPFSAYYKTAYDQTMLEPTLRDNIVFAHHNLVTDAVFAEVQLVVCRNVLIYFDRTLQERVLTLFADALERGGLLALGSKETLRFSSIADRFEPVNAEQKIWRKVA